MQGLIIENISNLYRIETEKGIYEANARGKFKKEEITPVVGDKVEIQILDEENKKAVIEEIQETFPFYPCIQCDYTSNTAM